MLVSVNFKRNTLLNLHFPHQRGSLALADGDPLTPNWPSLDNAYRWSNLFFSGSLACRLDEDWFLIDCWPAGLMRRTVESTCLASQCSQWVTQTQNSFWWGWKGSPLLRTGKEASTWFTSTLELVSFQLRLNTLTQAGRSVDRRAERGNSNHWGEQPSRGESLQQRDWGSSRQWGTRQVLKIHQAFY